MTTWISHPHVLGKFDCHAKIVKEDYPLAIVNKNGLFETRKKEVEIFHFDQKYGFWYIDFFNASRNKWKMMFT